MSNDDEILAMIEDLANDGGAVSLPGLDLDTIAENFVDNKYGSDLAQVKDEEERSKLRAGWVDYYKNGEGSKTLRVEIANIKAQYSAAKETLVQVQEGVVNAVASNAVPSVITVGTATSAPNPAYALLENKTKVNTLKALLKQIGAFLSSLLQSAMKIGFAIPTAVITLIKTLTTVKKAINAIPC